MVLQQKILVDHGCTTVYLALVNTIGTKKSDHAIRDTQVALLAVAAPAVVALAAGGKLNL